MSHPSTTYVDMYRTACVQHGVSCPSILIMSPPPLPAPPLDPSLLSDLPSQVALLSARVSDLDKAQARLKEWSLGSLQAKVAQIEAYIKDDTRCGIWVWHKCGSGSKAVHSILTIIVDALSFVLLLLHHQG